MNEMVAIEIHRDSGIPKISNVLLIISFQPNYNSTKVCFAYFGFYSLSDPEKQLLTLFLTGCFFSCRPPSFHQLGKSLSSSWRESAFLSRCCADAGTFSLCPSCFCCGGEFCSRSG